MDPYPPLIQFGDFPGEASKLSDMESRTAQIKVLYRELTLEDVSWADVYKATTGQGSADFPGGGDAKMKMQWVQYKLNELGYLAGPLTGDRNEQTCRALRRYTYDYPGIEESDDETQQGVIDKLKAGDRPRPHLIQDRKVLRGRKKASKIVLDHNYGFVNPNGLKEGFKGVGNANEPDGHADMDARKLDRFEVPLKVKATLVSKDDADGSAKGVDAPEAIGPVKCEWHVFDPPEATGLIHASFLGVDHETKAAVYLDEVKKALASATKDDPLDARDNCPVARGGARPDNPDDMTGYFHRSGLSGVIRDEHAGTKFLSELHDDLTKTWQKTWLGTSVAIFRGSYVAGDNWIVQPRISFEGHPRKAQLEDGHKALGKLANSFGDIRLEKSADPLRARTGTMTLWRRHRLRRVIDWWDYNAAPGISWSTLKNVFKAAFIELVQPPNGIEDINTVVNKANRKKYIKLFKEVAEAQGNTTVKGVDEARFTWSQQAIIPVAWGKQGDDEPIGTWAFRNNATNAVNAFAGGGAFYYAMYRVPAFFLKGLFDATDGAGLIVIRFQQFRPFDLPGLLNDTDGAAFTNGTLLLEEKPLNAGNAAARLKNYKGDSQRGDGGPSIGVDWGVAMLQHQHFAAYKDTFITLHEMGHCLYLSHAHDVPRDHDDGDRNCAMYYPETNQLSVDGWGLRVTSSPKRTAPHFCGKCLLKLRGWRIRDGSGPALPRGST